MTEQCDSAQGNTSPARIMWDQDTEKIFQQILEEIPAMIRGIAETRVTKKAESLVREDERLQVTEKDMVDAFFVETPAGFVPPMKDRMRQLKIDFKKYGYE